MNVIIGARIEQLNKQYKSQFLISEHSYDALEQKPVTVDLGEVSLKGIEKKVRIFQLA